MHDIEKIKKKVKKEYSLKLSEVQALCAEIDRLKDDIERLRTELARATCNDLPF